MQVIQLRCKQATAVCSSGVMPANALHSTLLSQLSAMQGHSCFLSDTLVILTFVRFEILTLVMQMIQVSWVVMLCCWASTWQCLDLMWCWFQPNTCSRIRRCNIWTDVAWHLHLSQMATKTHTDLIHDSLWLSQQPELNQATQGYKAWLKYYTTATTT
jgi:hypothetical protein